MKMNEEIDLTSIDLEDVGSPPSRKKTRISDVWNFFKKTGTKARCSGCGKEYTHSGNTSNLKDHLSRCSSVRRINSSATTSASATSLSSTSTSGHSSISYYFQKDIKYDKQSSRKRELDLLLTKMICKGCHPFSMVEEEGFREFVSALDSRYELPCKTTLKEKFIMKKYNELKFKIVSELKKIAYVAITCDMWSSRACEAYLTVTCHFINEDYKPVCYVLSTAPLLNDQNQKADNVTESIKRVFEEYDIEKKIICIVTDNCSTMLKMCENLRKRNLPCMAHTINLLVQDALKIECLNEILCKCKSIVRYFKSSNIATAKLKSKQTGSVSLKLIQEVPTRWNSCLEMLKRILQISDAINSALLEVHKAPAPINISEIATIKDLVNVLEPFEGATKQISSSKNVTVSLINPIICGIVFKMNDLRTKIVTEEGKLFVEHILKKIPEKFFHYENRTVTKIGTLIDPRFKKEGFRSPGVAEDASKLLENEMVLTTHMRGGRDEYESIEDTTEESSQNYLFGFLTERLATKKRTANVGSIVEKRQYLEQINSGQNADPLEYWKANENQLQCLSAIAKKYLCIPGSSVESERIFSKAGLIVNERRSCLKPKSVDALIFLQKHLK